MRKLFPFMLTLLFFSALLQHKTFAQVPDSAAVQEDENRKFEPVEIEAQFPGGASGWIKFLQRTLDPGVAAKRKAPAGTYTVVIQFIVNTDGKLSGFETLTNHGFGMEQEVIRVLKLSPPWEPAFQRGRNVKAYRKQPVTFQVIEEKKKKKNKDD